VKRDGSKEPPALHRGLFTATRRGRKAAGLGASRWRRGQPAYVYELTPEAQNLFPKGYEPVLRRLLDVLAERHGPEESEAMLRSVGHSMAEGQAAPTGGTRSRLEAAVGVLNELGGLAEIEEHDDGVVIRGYSCPLAGVTPDHPEVCRMAETLLTELAGAPVHEHCERGERPSCRFEVALPDVTAGGGEEGHWKPRPARA
jgi:predicted ArsR family transcriptional regulator